MSRSVGDIRTSQLITTFGPGAVTDLQRLSVIILGIDRWTIRDDLIIDEQRLRSALGVQALYSPLVEEGPRGPRGTIPSEIFPRYLVCPNSACRFLARIEDFNWDHRFSEPRCSDPRCPTQGRFRVNPSRFVVSCRNGHLDDFPFHDYVHDGPAGGCHGPLRLIDTGRTGSISDIIVRCESNNDSKSLGSAFQQNQNALGTCTGRRPWLGRDFQEDCSERPEAILRGASNLYFPIVRSALSIPPWAAPIHEDIARYERFFGNVADRSALETVLNHLQLPDLAPYSVDEILEALLRRRGVLPAQTTDELLRPEWSALRQPTRAAGRTDFETEHVDIPDGFEDLIEQVVLVHRLKEVRALQGFTRIEPPGAWGDVPDDPNRVAPLSRGSVDWLPAIVVRGEGVFIELRHEAVRAWAEIQAVQLVLRQMGEAQNEWRAARNLPPGPVPDPSYVLCHTLAHLLMRRMSLDAGYSSSSLRERIYGMGEGEEMMTGLLIYTATTDSDGSLGGLVDLGRPQKLRPLLRQALEEARLCSSDPLCSDNEPRVKGMLNGAACHACLLASETSCERGNRLLDRAVLVPTLSKQESGYFNALLTT